MGHACNSGSGCDNLFQKRIPDTQIIYTGNAIPALGICTGDYLSEIEATLLQKIIDFSTGVGISIESIDLTTCDLFTNELVCCETCTDLPCLLQSYLTGLCTLYTDFTTLQTQVNALLNGPYNKACLSGLGSSPTLTQIIQELILEFCALLSSFNTLQTTVSGITSSLSTNIGNFLLSAITSCTGTTSVIKSGTGATASIAFKGFAPIGSILPYAGDLSVFDATGAGFSGTTACGWALCNGNNGTVNMSGLIPVGTGMGPAVIIGAVLPYNTTGGEYAHVLSSAESPLPAHSHSITDPGHNHTIQYQHQTRSIPNGGPDNYVDFSGAMTGTTPWTENPGAILHNATPFASQIGGILNNKTGITGTNSAGGGGTASAHNNMPPYRALYYIQRIS